MFPTGTPLFVRLKTFVVFSEKLTSYGRCTGGFAVLGPPGGGAFGSVSADVPFVDCYLLLFDGHFELRVECRELACLNLDFFVFKYAEAGCDYFELVSSGFEFSEFINARGITRRACHNATRISHCDFGADNKAAKLVRHGAFERSGVLLGPEHGANTQNPNEHRDDPFGQEVGKQLATGSLARFIHVSECSN